MPSIWLVVFMMRTFTVVFATGILRSGGGGAILRIGYKKLVGDGE
jgi:hypothetical protein